MQLKHEQVRACSFETLSDCGFSQKYDILPSAVQIASLGLVWR